MQVWPSPLSKSKACNSVSSRGTHNRAFKRFHLRIYCNGNTSTRHVPSFPAFERPRERPTPPARLPAPLLTAVIKRSKTLKELIYTCRAHAGELNHIHVSAAFSTAVYLPNIDGDPAVEQGLNQLLHLFESLLPNATCREVAGVLWCLAKMGRPAPETMLSSLLSEHQRRGLFADAPPQSLANILWSLATWRTRGRDPLLSILVEACAIGLPAFKPQDTSNVLWSLARLGHHPGSLLPRLSALAAQQAAQLPPRGLASTVWACSRLRHHDSALLRAAATAFRAQLAAATPADIAVFTAGLAGLHFRSPELLRDVTRRCCDQLTRPGGGGSRSPPAAAHHPAQRDERGGSGSGDEDGYGSADLEGGGGWSARVRQRLLWSLAVLRYRDEAVLAALLRPAVAGQGGFGGWGCEGAAAAAAGAGRPGVGQAGAGGWSGEPGAEGGGLGASSFIWCMARLRCGLAPGPEQDAVLTASRALWAGRGQASFSQVAVAVWGLERLGLADPPLLALASRMAVAALEATWEDQDAERRQSTGGGDAGKRQDAGFAVPAGALGNGGVGGGGGGRDGELGGPGSLSAGELDAVVMLLWCLGRRGAADPQLLDAFSLRARRLVPRLSPRQLPLVCCAFVQLGRDDTAVLGTAVELLMAAEPAAAASGLQTRAAAVAAGSGAGGAGGAASGLGGGLLSRLPHNGLAITLWALAAGGHASPQLMQRAATGVLRLFPPVAPGAVASGRAAVGGAGTREQQPEQVGGATSVAAAGADASNPGLPDAQNETPYKGAEGGTWDDEEGDGGASVPELTEGLTEGPIERVGGATAPASIAAAPAVAATPRSRGTGWESEEGWSVEAVPSAATRDPASTSPRDAAGQQQTHSSGGGSAGATQGAEAGARRSKWAALILWAFAAANCYNAVLYDTLLSYVLRKVSALGPGRVAMVLWACAMGGHYRRDAVDRLCAVLQEREGSLPPASFTQANWAVAHLTAGLSLRWRGPAPSRVASLAPALSRSQAAMLLWSLATQQLVLAGPDPRVFAGELERLLNQLAAGPVGALHRTELRGGGGGGGECGRPAASEGEGWAQQLRPQPEAEDGEGEGQGLENGGETLIVAESLALLLLSPHKVVRQRAEAFLGEGDGEGEEHSDTGSEVGKDATLSPSHPRTDATTAGYKVSGGSGSATARPHRRRPGPPRPSGPGAWRLVAAWQRTQRRRHPQQGEVAAAARQLGYIPRVLRTHPLLPLAVATAVELPDAAPGPAVLLLCDLSDFASNVVGQPLGPLFVTVQLLKERGWRVAVVLAQKFGTLRMAGRRAAYLRQLLAAAGVTGSARAAGSGAGAMQPSPSSSPAPTAPAEL